MNRKISRKIILLANFSHGEKFTAVKAYSSYRMKDAKAELEFFKRTAPKLTEEKKDIKIEDGLIMIPNGNFKLYFKDIHSKYYGSQFKFRIYSKEFEKYPGWGWNEREFIIAVDHPTMANILMNKNIIDGAISGEFSIDTHSSGWFLNSTSIVFGDTPELSDWMNNYDEFFESKTTHTLDPGSIYIDRHGEIYLCLATDIYSKVFGNVFNSYQFCRHWGSSNVSTDSLEKSTILFRVDDRDILKQKITNFEDFWDLVFIKYSEYLSKYSSPTSIRIRKATSGKFAKIGELSGYKEIYGMTNWNIMKEEIISHIEKIIPGSGHNGVFDQIPLVLTFNENKYSALSPYLAKIYRDYIEYYIKDKIKNPGWRDKDRFPELYTPTKELLDNEVEIYIRQTSQRSYTIPDIAQLYTLGVFADIEDARNFLNNIRGWTKLE